MIKPDARERGLVGEVISRFEKKRFSIVNMRIHCVTLQEAQLW
jgi:nucleoside diphosphate kinase